MRSIDNDLMLAAVVLQKLVLLPIRYDLSVPCVTRSCHEGHVKVNIEVNGQELDVSRSGVSAVRAASSGTTCLCPASPRSCHKVMSRSTMRSIDKKHGCGSRCP